MGLAFLCLGIFAGFGGKIEGFVKGADEPTTGGTTSSYENAMIYVDSGATTNITGGSVGSMESGNSVYVADGGTLNVTGGTVSGNIYNGGTLNYTAGTLNSVTLASGKYITFKGNPSSTISITLDSPSVGTNIGYLDGITSVTLSRLSVTNLPANTELRISGNYITIAYVDRTVSFEVDPSGYGTVSQSTLTLPHGSSVSVSGSTLSYGSTSITATPATQTAQYTYSFDGWYVGDTQIESSRTITANTTITARFTRTTRTYTVTILRNYRSYGTVSTSSVTNVPYGTVLSTSSNTLNVNGTIVTATPASQTAQYSYSFSSWTNGTATVTGNLTVTANFSRSTRSYTITIAVSPSGYGSVSQTSVTADYGTSISTSGSTLSIGDTDITATPARQTAQYTYSFSSWSNASGTVTGARTITANFSRSTRTYTVTVIPRYSTSTSGTNATATNGITGGTVSTTSTSTTNMFSVIIPGISYNSSVSITASPESGYSFVGWYTSTSSTSATSTSSTYRPTVTSSRTYYAFFRKAGYTVTFTKTVSAPSTFAPSSLFVQEDPGISVYYIVMRALQRGPTATWGGDGLTSNQSSYTVSGSQDFYVKYIIPETTTVEGTGTTIGYTESHSVKIVKNGTTVVNKSSTTTLQTGTYNFTTTSTTTIEIELKTWQSGAVITFDDNLSNENKDNPIYIDKRQYVILQKRILY